MGFNLYKKICTKCVQCALNESNAKRKTMNWVTLWLSKRGVGVAGPAKRAPSGFWLLLALSRGMHVCFCRFVKPLFSETVESYQILGKVCPPLCIQTFLFVDFQNISICKDLFFDFSNVGPHESEHFKKLLLRPAVFISDVKQLHDKYVSYGGNTYRVLGFGGMQQY